MNKNLNTIYAVVLVFGFVLLWDKLVMSRYSSPVAQQAQAQKAIQQETPQQQSRPSQAILSHPTAFNNRDAAPHATGPSTVTLKADGHEVVLVAEGGKIASWHLKEKGEWLEMLMPKPEDKPINRPLDMFQNASYSINKVTESQAILTGTTPDGLVIEKTITLLAQPPFHAVDLRISNATPSSKDLNLFMGWGNGLDKHPVEKPHDKKDTVASENRAVAYGAKLMTWKTPFLFEGEPNKHVTGAYKWVGVENHHFLAAFVPTGDATFSDLLITVKKGEAPQAGISISDDLGPGQSIYKSFLLYVGPKQEELLAQAGHNLTESIDYGIFGFIAKILITTLNFYHGMTHNYGWSIILLTLTIQVLMFPLTKKSLSHAVRMKEFQPHLKKLQEQYKEDPKRLQIETMNLYRKNGMKFMGLDGCLPMLLQMPIFLAFYNALNSAYDLRGAEWIFWITDLASKDPYYVLPILMGAGMYFQQKATGVSADPAQAKMMALMPIVFTFMFLQLPSGLVLYWVVNSLSTIVIQKMLTMNQRSKPQPIVV